MNPQDKNNTTQDRGTTKEGGMSIKDRVSLIIAVFIITFTCIGIGSVVLLILQLLGVIHLNLNFTSTAVITDSPTPKDKPSVATTQPTTTPAYTTQPTTTPAYTTQPTTTPAYTTQPTTTPAYTTIYTPTPPKEPYKITPLGASFTSLHPGTINSDETASASIVIENISGKDLLLLAEEYKYTLISDSGQSANGYSNCSLNGLKKGYNIHTNNLDVSTLSRIKPNEKIAVSIDNCTGIDHTKTKFLSVTIPILQLDGNQPVSNTISYQNIPIK